MSEFFAWRVCSRPLVAEPPPLPGEIALRRLRPEGDLHHFAQPHIRLGEAKARTGFERGEICIGGFDRSSLVGYAWFTCDPAPHRDDLWMVYDPRAVYIYRAFVHPAYRGRGIAPALYRYADPLFLAEGRRSALLCIGIRRRASLAAARRSGARVAGYGAYLRAGPLFVQWRTPGARRLGFRFSLDPGQARAGESRQA